MPLPHDCDVAASKPAMLSVQRAEYYVRPHRAGWIIARAGDEYGAL